MSTVWQSLGRALSPVEERPRVVGNLESAVHRTRSGTPYVVVHNPERQSYARLDPREFELLPLMDGQRSVKELVIAYYQRNNVLALARVAGLVRLLRQQGLLTTPPASAYTCLTDRLRVGPRRRAWSVELTTRSIDGVLEEAYRGWGRLFFTRVWLWIGVALGIVGPMLVMFELLRGRYALFDVGGWGALTIVALGALTLFALAVHELGHGLAVKHAGRSVHTAGVRLYVGLPAAFVDTTDIWMAAPGQRLLTAFAGPWTGLVVGGLCAIAATLLGGGEVGALLFTAAFVFVVDTLFNFNPLLELDGYYMLIDVLDRPLLRAEALAFVRGPLWQRLRSRQSLSREEKLLSLFGVAAAAYSVVTVLVAIRAWQSLLGPIIGGNLRSSDLARQLLGLLVLLAIVGPLGVGVGLVLTRFAKPLRSWLDWLSGRAAERRHRDAVAALRAVPMWAELPTGRLLEVARAMRAEDVRAGTEVIREGEPGDRFYLIARGGFEVRIEERPQVHLGRGDFFGERALLQRTPRAATVVATEPGQLFVVEGAAFAALLATDLAAGARIQAALAYRDEVAAMPIFGDLSPHELDALLSRLQPLELAAGESVIRQGEPGDRFYVVRSGSVRVERDGQELAQLGPGEAFGEIALLLDIPRTATVTATAATRLLALDAADFRDILASYLGRAGELERLSHLRLLSHKRLVDVL